MESQNSIMQYGECRCCLSKGNHRDLHKEYYINGQRIVCMDVFMECFNLFLSTEPHMSTQICAPCIRRLRDAQSFRKLVLDNEKRLLEAHGDKQTEFVNVVLDPLVEEPVELDGDIKVEVKSESPGLYFSEVEDDLGTIEDFIPGEKELLERFPTVKRLPTRESLSDSCPIFFGHLEYLRGKVVKARAIEELTKNSYHHKSRKKNTKFINNSVTTEKLAYALNTTTILENSNATAFKAKMRSGFPCFYCRNIFSNPKVLREHQSGHPKNLLFKLLTKYTADALIVYADITDLKCTICNENIPSIKDLKDHLVNKHNKKMYSNVSDRVIPFKLGDKESNFDCQICGINFETFGATDRHMNVHYKNYVCEECGAGFITRHRLKTHTYMLHKKSNNIISCEPCKKIFPNRHKYKIHYENVHEKMKKMKCPNCSDKFVDYFSRQRHMEEVHGVEPILYKCTECDRSFNRKYSLKCHFKRRHLVNKDVQCEVCPFMCFTKSELKEHMYKHGGGEKSFNCDVCTKAFMRKKSLTVHMRVHSNDTRYSCHKCGETFIQNWSLKSHLKSHEYADL